LTAAQAQTLAQWKFNESSGLLSHIIDDSSENDYSVVFGEKEKQRIMKRDAIALKDLYVTIDTDTQEHTQIGFINEKSNSVKGFSVEDCGCTNSMIMKYNGTEMKSCPHL
jgi:hypothetical protein